MPASADNAPDGPIARWADLAAAAAAPPARAALMQWPGPWPARGLALIEGADDARIARFLAGQIGAWLAQDGEPVVLCLPGGATPFPILQRLVGERLDWPRVQIWPGDDRLVPEEHEASNTGRIRALFAPTGAVVHALGGVAAPGVPRFRLVWLGMGEDGHVASLFAGNDPRADDPEPVRRLIPEPLPPEAPFARVTLTIPALINTDRLMFVLRGARKRALFEAAVRAEGDLPIARLLAAARGKVEQTICFV